MKTIMVVTFETGVSVSWFINRGLAYVDAMEKIMEVIREYGTMEGPAKSFSVEYKEV